MKKSPFVHKVILSGTYFNLFYCQCIIYYHRSLKCRNCLERWLDDAKFDESLKNPIKSKEVRIKANEHFKRDQLELCYKLYTKAAQLAPCKSMELAISFSNRSAMYWRWNKFHV